MGVGESGACTISGCRAGRDALGFPVGLCWGRCFVRNRVLCRLHYYDSLRLADVHDQMVDRMPRQANSSIGWFSFAPQPNG